MSTTLATCECNNGSGRTSGIDSTTWDLRKAVRDFERRYISVVLESAGGDKVKAARRLGIGLSSLYRKLEELEILKEGPGEASGNGEERP